MIEVIVVAEASADQEMACGLADRVTLEFAGNAGKESTGAASLASVRSWVGLEPDTAFTPWARIKAIADNVGLSRYLGHGAISSGYDFATGRKALLLCQRLRPSQTPQHCLFVRDMDNQPERGTSLTRLRNVFQEKGFRLFLALPSPNREAWLLPGFVPQNQKEKSIHSEVKNELGFDPCLMPERMSANTSNAPKSAKKVMAKLCSASGEKRNRENSCWQDAPLKDLKNRGKNTGLAAYLAEIEGHFAPIISISTNEQT